MHASTAITASLPRASLLVLGAYSLILSTLGCRAKMEVQTKSGGPTSLTTPLSQAGPVKRTSGVQQDPDKVLLPIKQVYQSREVLRIRVSAAMIGSATNLSMLNVTGFGQEAEANAPVVVDQAPIPTSLGLTTSGDHDSFGLTGASSVTLTRDAEGLVVAIQPTNSDMRKLFKYGVNKLKIVAIDPVEDRFTYATITLKDFDAMGPTMAHFAGPNPGPVGTADDGSQFQGWVNVVSPPVVMVKEGEAYRGSLANGVFNMVQ